MRQTTLLVKPNNLQPESDTDNIPSCATRLNLAAATWSYSYSHGIYHAASSAFADGDGQHHRFGKSDGVNFLFARLGHGGARHGLDRT